MIRKAEKTDREKILELYEGVKDSPFCTWNEYYPGEEDIDIDLGNSALFVMEEDGEIIGALSLVTADDADELDIWDVTKGKKTGELERICVSYSFSGKGLAGELVSYGESVLREKGCEGIRLLCAKINIPAYRTYYKAGYTVSGECGLYGNEYLAMEKLL